MNQDVQHDVVVVGAGLAGLAAAATAAGEGASVLVLDGRAPGGRATSDQVGRFVLNRGAHALYRRAPGRAVLARLGVQVTGSLPPTGEALGRLRDRVEPLPGGPVSLVRTRLVGGRTKWILARVLAGAGRWRPEDLGGRTAATWFGDLADGDADARALLETLGRTATYCSDFETVSADLVAGQIQAALRGNVEYLHGGWATLVDALAAVARRRGVHIRAGGTVRGIVPEGRRVRVEVAGGDVLARRVVLAAGTPEAGAALLPETPAGWAGLGPAARVACLDLGLARVPDRSVLLGVDRPLYLIRHGPPASGLAPAGAATVHAMRYLRPDEELPPGEARAELDGHCRLIGIDPEAAEEARYLHRMVACPALPLPEAGGMRGRPGVTGSGFEGVLVAGDWVGPTGHLADASLASGEDAGRRAAAGLERDPVVAAPGAVSGRTAGAA